MSDWSSKAILMNRNHLDGLKFQIDGEKTERCCSGPDAFSAVSSYRQSGVGDLKVLCLV